MRASVPSVRRQLGQPVLLLPLLLHCLLTVCEASAGDAHPLYSSCVESCGESGCVDGACLISGCNFPVDGIDRQGDGFTPKEPFYLRWREWDCLSECRYQCMLKREVERQAEELPPVKYHGRWPFVRLFSLQEPASVAFSMLNLLVHFQGLWSFLMLLKLPVPAQGTKVQYYEYAGLWTIYGLLSINSWIWSAVFHSRDIGFTEKMDYSSAIVLMGYSLMLAIIRTFNFRIEAQRVMVAAPTIAFVSTHILYLNLYKFDYGWNMKVCVAMGVAQLLLWGVWSVAVRHPARHKLLTVIYGTVLTMFLEIYDFPPLWGVFDAHAIWHATTLPLTYFWWSFIKDDALFRPRARQTQPPVDQQTKKLQ